MRQSIALVVGLVFAAASAEAATQITTSTGNAFWSASSFYTHHAAGHFWVALHNGTEPVLWSSPDGVTWTPRGPLFSTFMPADTGQWAVRYYGTTLIAFAYNSGNTNRYYGRAVLNPNGTPTWTTADLQVTGVTGAAQQPLNALIINGKPVMWRAGLTNADSGRLTFGSALDAPITWTDSADAPALSAVTSGVYGGGAVFATGGPDPNDIIVLRATTASSDTPGAHRLVSIKYDAGGAGFDAGWFNVSLRGTQEIESNTTEVRVGAEADIHRKFTAVSDTNGNIHAVYVNQQGDAVHYKKDVGFNDDWTIVSTDVIQSGTLTGKAALSAAENGNLFLYYEKNDSTAYYRRFDGAAWGPENALVATPDLRQALAPMESSVGCTQALAWFQNALLPWDVRFSLGGAPCAELAVAESGGRVTVTAAGSYELVLDQAFGGSIVEFYDLTDDPGRTLDLAGGAAGLNGLMMNGVTVGATSYANDSNDSTAQRAKLDVIEVTETRVKIRQEAFYEEQNGGAAVVPGLKSISDYTIQPSGKAAVRWERRVESAVTTVNHGMGALAVHTNPLDETLLGNWGFYTDGGDASGSPYTGDRTFGLARIDQLAARTDFLQILYENFGAANQLAYFDGNPGGQAWAGWSYYDPDGVTYTAGTSEVFNFLTYFKPTTFVDNLDPQVTERRDDYRGPYDLNVMVGQAWIDADENTPISNDKFNESEGTYLVDMDATNGVRFDINGLATNRFSPMFKLRQYRSLQKPSTMLVEGVTKTIDLDFRADVKPVSRATFTKDLMWHSTLQDGNAVTSPDVGNPGIVGANATGPVPGRYGMGIHLPDDINSFIEFPRDFNFDAAKGAIEFWHKPDYASTDGVAHSLGGFNFNGTNYWRFEKDNTNTLRFEIKNGTESAQTVIPPALYGWQAGEWVHFRFEWDNSLSVANQLRIFVNGVERNPGAGTGNDYTLQANISTNIRIGRRNPDPNGSPGVYDEIYVYGGPDTMSTEIAHGGLTSSSSEYLADNGKNFTLAFDPLDGFSRGEYLYVGADSKFRGLNVLLDTIGSGAAPSLQWEFWNGSAWTIFPVTDPTAGFTASPGTLYWSVPSPWARYSMHGGPDLFYVRAHLLSGSYTTHPVERLVKTDILLLQYCGVVTADLQTFELAAPLATAVELTSFEATSSNGAVLLSWETGSELDNLGFDIYRSMRVDEGYERITAHPIPGLGSSPQGARYEYRDTDVTSDTTYYYELFDIDASGETTRHGPVAVTVQGSDGATPPPPGSPSPDESAAHLTYGDPSATTLTVVRRTALGIVLELGTGGFEAYTLEDGAVRFAVPGFSPLIEEDAPLLPVRRETLEAIAGREVAIRSVRALEVERFSGLRPGAADVEIVADSRGAVRAELRGRGRFASRSLSPSAWARIESVGYQGATKKALVQLSPLRWDGTRGELVLAKRLIVHVSFARPEASEQNGGAAGRSRRPRPPTTAPVTARLVTRDPGLHAVTFEAVHGRRARPVEAASLRLSRLGRATPFHLEPDDGRFAPGSVLYFVAEGAPANPYGDEAVYELDVGGNGERMTVEDVTPRGDPLGTYWHTVLREENHQYQPALLHAPDRWLWEILFAPVAKDFTVDVKDLAIAPGLPPRLTVWMQGASDAPAEPDHHVRFFLNGVLLQEASWDGKSPHRADVPVPPSVLHEGENLLTVENVGDTQAPYSMVMLDRFELGYPRIPLARGNELAGEFLLSGAAVVSGLEPGAKVVDVTDPGNARWLTGTSQSEGSLRFRTEANRRYRAVGPSALRTPEVRRAPTSRLKRESLGADYVLVAPSAFLPGLHALVELRRAQGLKVAPVSLETVYSEFGFGETRPEAIRDFLAHAYSTWEPAPRYVLLVGDATYDFKNYLGLGFQSSMPPLMVATPTLWTASDQSYAMVHGNDLLPDVAIGRLTVSSLEELRAAVDKILAFESGGTSFGRGRAVLVADLPDRAGDFVRDAEELAGTVLAGRDVTKIYLSELPPGAAPDAIREAFDEGASLVSYLGHGGIHLWSNTNAFDTSEVAGLAPSSENPFLLAMNCLNGYFHFPYLDSLAEELLNADGRGVVAAMAPSGLSFNDAAHRYHSAILNEIAFGAHPRLGDAILAAQASYAETGAEWSLLQIYNLLGDPALTLR